MSVTVQIGKLVGENLYVHKEALSRLPESFRLVVEHATEIAPEAVAQANVFKIHVECQTVSALLYPEFFDQAFPELAQSWRIHLGDARVTHRTYSESTNPPILHRKELLLPLDDPRRSTFEALTQQAEQLGLFSDASLIGFRRSWEDKIRAAGYFVDGHTLQPLGNELAAAPEERAANDPEVVQRYRTALSRNGLSAPMLSLGRHGLLSEGVEYFDYGCGRGDDMAALKANGLTVAGWDPHFAPDEPKLVADVVNLGFVINVIENFDERVAALQGSYKLCRQMLVVSTMLYGGTPPAGRPFQDGYLTQRNTFQKYFTQSELKEFVEAVLDNEAIPVGPGIMFVFRDKEAEQRFLFGRQRNQHTLALLGYRRERAARQPRTPRLPKQTRVQRLMELHGGLIEDLWIFMLNLGRIPEESEFPKSRECVEGFGSWGRTLRFITIMKDRHELELAAEQRKVDLIVYLSLQLFSRRKAYRQLELGLQRDIKSHFGDYQRAQAVARQYLQDAACPELLDTACETASGQGLGYYVASDYLQLHVSLIERLPPLLRVYVGCGAVLYGDLDDVDLVKIHIRSGKVTFMKFDDFFGSPLPRMLEREKVRLRDQDVDYFFYRSPYEPPVLYYKSRYLSEDSPMFEEQFGFDEHLEAEQLFDPASFGPSRDDLDAALRRRRLQVEGYRIVESCQIPGLDEPCGAQFTYRDFVECGETWERTRVANIPKQPETYNALYRLATELLDPIVDYFGMIKLTYGFAGPELTKQVPGRIAPKLDQHASYELNRQGKLICNRLGAAVDFIIEDEDMFEAAKWITNNLPFDRLYIFKPDRPIHLSYGPQATRQVTIQGLSGDPERRIPRTIGVQAFNNFVWP